MSVPNGVGLGTGQPADSGMVGRRAGPPRDGTNFAGQNPDTLYAQVQSADPGQVGQVAQSWSNIGDALDTVNQVLSTGASNGAGGWTGAAAANALRFHTQVAQWTAVATQASYEAGGNVASQSDAAATAKYSMPKPVNYGMSQAITDFQADPFNIGAIQGKLDQAQQNHQQITQVAQRYDASLNEASQQMPALGPTPSFAGPSSGNPSSAGPSRIGHSSGPAGGDSGGTAAGRPFQPGGGVRSGTGGQGGSGQPVAPISPGPGQGQGTGLSGIGSSDGGGLGSGGGSGFDDSPGGGSAGGGDSGLLPIGGFGGGAGFGGAGREGSGSGAGGGSGMAGRGGFGGGRSGSGPDGGAAGGAGGRSAAGAMSAAEEASANGTAGGPAGTGMGAGRGRKGADDQEHQRPSYLVERDPDSIFGIDETTAPPVIGG